MHRISECRQRIITGMLMMFFAGDVFSAAMCCTPEFDEESFATIAKDRVPCHGQDNIDSENTVNCCTSCVSMMAPPDDSMLNLDFRQSDQTCVARLIIDPPSESPYRPPINHLS